MPTSLVTRKSQVTIPKEIREQVELEVGDRVSFVVRDGEIVLKPPPKSILDLRGSVKAKQHPEDFDAVRQQTKAAVGSRVARGD